MSAWSLLRVPDACYGRPDYRIAAILVNEMSLQSSRVRAKTGPSIAHEHSRRGRAGLCPRSTRRPAPRASVRDRLGVRRGLVSAIDSPSGAAGPRPRRGRASDARIVARTALLAPSTPAACPGCKRPARCIDWLALSVLTGDPSGRRRPCLHPRSNAPRTSFLRRNDGYPTARSAPRREMTFNRDPAALRTAFTWIHQAAGRPAARSISLTREPRL